MAPNTTRYRLLPPERAADAGERPLVIDTAGWPESAAAVLAWLLRHEIAKPYGLAEELVEAFDSRLPITIARAIVGLGEPEALAVLARLQGDTYVGSGQHGQGGSD